MKITTLIKRAILQIIKKIGYNIVSVKPTIKGGNYDAIIKFLIKDLKKVKNPIIFDVGANTGQSIDRFLKLFKSNKKEDCQIYSFEPTPQSFEILNKKKNNQVFENQINLFQLALDNKITKSKFYSYNYNLINSLIKIDENSKFYKSRKLAVSDKFNTNFKNEIEVQTTTIDQIVDQLKINKIDILKIDTQGNEDRVLEGSKNLLSLNKINVIELELILGFGYQKQMSFFDIERILNIYNYRLIAIDYASNIISNSNYQVNLIYVNSELFEKIKKLHYENQDIKDVMNKTDRLNPFSY